MSDNKDVATKWDENHPEWRAFIKWYDTNYAFAMHRGVACEAWKARAADKRGEPVGITLTGKQLRNALEFVNPDGVSDLDQLECEVTIRHFPDAIDGDGEAMPSGIYAYLAEYPEEGRVSLDADLAPQPDRKAIEDEVIERCAKICSQISLDIQMQGESLSGCTSYIADRCAEVIRALKGSK